MDPNDTLVDLLDACTAGAEAREYAVDALRRLLNWVDDQGGPLPRVLPQGKSAEGYLYVVLR